MPEGSGWPRGGLAALRRPPAAVGVRLDVPPPGGAGAAGAALAPARVWALTLGRGGAEQHWWGTGVGGGKPISVPVPGRVEAGPPVQLYLRS